MVEGLGFRVWAFPKLGGSYYLGVDIGGPLFRKPPNVFLSGMLGGGLEILRVLACGG